MTLLDKVRRHYANEIRRERGALAEFARDLGIEPRAVDNWQRLGRPIPAIYADDVARLTRGAVKAADVVKDDLAFCRARKDAMFAARVAAKAARTKRRAT